MSPIRTALYSSALFLLAFVSSAQASTTLYVDGVNGNDNNRCLSLHSACKTIGHAISLASSGDTIRVGPATYVENLIISNSLNILGANTGGTVVDGSQSADVFRISGGVVLLSNLTIQNGYMAGDGGGIVNFGTLTLTNCTITGNTGSAYTGGIANFGMLTVNRSTVTGNSGAGYGGGIVNEYIATINNSTIAGNNGGSYGGGIVNFYTATVNNSTITGNTGISGGGIVNFDVATVSNSTIAQNNGGSGGGGFVNFATATVGSSTIAGNSGGVYGSGVVNYDGPVTLQNTIMATNSGGNCDQTVSSNGYNLSDDNSCNFSGPGDLNNTNPLLGTLGNYGGPTQTIPLLAGSPAIDAGNPPGCTDGNGNLLLTDQRGAPRPDKEDANGCDIGAYEKQLN